MMLGGGVGVSSSYHYRTSLQLRHSYSNWSWTRAVSWREDSERWGWHYGWKLKNGLGGHTRVGIPLNAMSSSLPQHHQILSPWPYFFVLLTYCIICLCMICNVCIINWGVSSMSILFSDVSQQPTIMPATCRLLKCVLRRNEEGSPEGQRRKGRERGNGCFINDDIFIITAKMMPPPPTPPQSRCTYKKLYKTHSGVLGFIFWTVWVLSEEVFALTYYIWESQCLPFLGLLSHSKTTRWLKATEISSLTVLEAESIKWSCWQGGILPKAQSENLFHAPSSICSF